MSRKSRIYLGRLSYQAKERDVERFFRGFGRIRDINLKNGFGFVEFDDPRDADDAVYELHGRELMGEKVIVEHARGARDRDSYNWRDSRDSYRSRDYDRGRGRNFSSSSSKYGPPLRTDYRLRVDNISSRVSWQDLKDFMRSAGEITYADAHKQRVGEGIVEYATYDDMKNALKKLDGAELNGRKLRLTEESRNRSRSQSRSRSRSRSNDRRYRSRSGSHDRKDHSRSRSPDGSKDGSPDARNSDGDDNRRRRHSSSRERSPSRDRYSNERENNHGDDRERSPSKSVSRSPRDNDHSRSASPMENDHSPGNDPRNNDDGSPRDEYREKYERSESPVANGTPEQEEERQHSPVAEDIDE